MIILPKLFAYNNKHLIAMFPSDWQSEGKMRSGLRYLYYAFFSICKSHSSWSVHNRWDPPMSDFKIHVLSIHNNTLLHEMGNGRFCKYCYFKRINYIFFYGELIVYNVGWGLLCAFYQAGCFCPCQRCATRFLPGLGSSVYMPHLQIICLWYAPTSTPVFATTGTVETVPKLHCWNQWTRSYKDSSY